MDDKDNLIKALKISNEGRQIIICTLIKEGVEKAEEITKLKDRIMFLEKWAAWNIGKSDR